MCKHGPRITITHRWGPRSWRCEYYGEYQNDRPPHVAISDQDIVHSGDQYRLHDLSLRQGWDCEGQIIYTAQWLVEQLHSPHGDRRDPAHFTVYYGRNLTNPDFCPAKM